MKLLEHIPHVVINSLTQAFPMSSGVALSKVERITRAPQSPLATSFINAALLWLIIADVLSQPLQACINNIFLAMS